MTKIKIIDDSGDRNYFTMIPNYILNHSTAKAQALYMQLKKLAGEKGIAFPSRDYLMKKLDISKPTLLKELQYLLDKNWIESIGNVPIKTSGGNQYVKGYKIVDIWKLNVDYYEAKGVKNSTHLDQEGVKNDTEGGKIDDPKGVKNRPPNKNIREEEPINKILATETVAGKEIGEIIDLFKTINPSYKRFYGNTSQRSAVERMLKELGYNKLLAAIEAMNWAYGKPFAPVITSPYQLETKLSALRSFYGREMGEKKKKGRIIVGYNK